MRYLSDKNVQELLHGDITPAVECMRDMFAAMGRGDYALGGENGASHGMRCQYDYNGSYRMFIAMPGHLGEPFNVTGMKWHGPNNHVDGSPEESYFVVVLNDVNTGEPYAMMRAEALTRYRTAATNALAATLLSVKEPEVIAVLGPGRINLLTLRYLLKTYPSVQRVQVKGRGLASRQRFLETMQAEFPNVTFVPCDSFKQAVIGADISLVNAGLYFTNYKDMAYLKTAWIKKGSSFICSAYAFFQDPLLTGNSVKVCDNFAFYESCEKELGYPAYRSMGIIGNRFADLLIEKKISRDSIWNLSDVVIGHKQVHPAEHDAVIFSSCGTSLEDIALGSWLYARAKEQNIGMEVE